MKRKIVKIHQEDCNGCGLCVEACHEGAIVLQNGKAVLVSDSYCDGLGDCLPECPTGAIEIVERDAAPFDQHMVAKRMEEKAKGIIGREQERTHKRIIGQGEPSALGNWPVQIKLAPSRSPIFEGASLLIAADCTAFSYANFHKELLEGRVCLIGCPKLDATNYSEKLATLFAENSWTDITVVRMEVPCCGGIVFAVEEALQQCGKAIPWSIHTISTDGNLLE